MRPVGDGRPFFWHFASYNKVIANSTHSINAVNFEDQLGESVLLLLLVLATVLAAVFLFLPFLAIRGEWRRFPRKGRSAAYFGAVGLGFFFFEVALIQRLVLFLGYPTYSITVTLASLLIFTGIGALITGRLGTRARRGSPLLLTAIAPIVSCNAISHAVSGNDICNCLPLEPEAADYRHLAKHVPLPQVTPTEITVQTILSWPQTLFLPPDAPRTGRENQLFHVRTAYLQNASINTRWDRLNLVYFLGYAFWGYYTLAPTCQSIAASSGSGSIGVLGF